MTTTVYLHGSREQMYETGKKLGLTGEALSMFSYACYEVKVDLRVNQTTGQATITHIDGRAVADV